MIYISKGSIPQFWMEFIQTHPRLEYKDLEQTEEGAIFRRKIREHNTKLQYGLCCYCCKRINQSNTSNEHIKPQSRFPKETLEYLNIVSSCNTSITCTNRKGSKFDESRFLSPLDPSCEEEFDYAPNGTISAVSVKGEYTINLLNLNSKELCRAREAIYRICCSYPDSETLRNALLVVDENGDRYAFVNVIKYFYKKVFS